MLHILTYKDLRGPTVCSVDARRVGPVFEYRYLFGKMNFSKLFFVWVFRVCYSKGIHSERSEFLCCGTRSTESSLV